MSYLPGHPLAEVEFAVAGWHASCTAAEALMLAAALVEALAAYDPSRRTSGWREEHE